MDKDSNEKLDIDKKLNDVDNMNTGKKIEEKEENRHVEFAGNSSDSDPYEVDPTKCREVDYNLGNIEFAGDTSDSEEDSALNQSSILNTAFCKDTLSFAGDESSGDSTDFYEPSSEKISRESYEFELEPEPSSIFPFKSRMKRTSVPDPDFTEPSTSTGTRPTVKRCNHYCKNECEKIKNMNFQSEIRNIHSKLSTMNNQEKRNYILDQIKFQDRFGLSTDRFIIKSENLCVNYFSFCTGLSLKVLNSVQKDFCHGIEQYSHGASSTKRLTAPMLRFISWMVSFSRLYGEHSPDEAGVVVLPAHLTKAKLFIIYSETVRQDLLAHSTFYQALGTKFGRNRTDPSLPCVTIPKDSSHCKCNECLSLKKFRRCAKTEVQIDVAEQLLKNHFNMCGKERMNVWSKFQRCIDFPKENLGIQFDDMDQTKTNLPRFSERAKSQSNFRQLKTHCTGVIIHSGLYDSNRNVHLILNNDQYEQGMLSLYQIFYQFLFSLSHIYCNVYNFTCCCYQFPWL